MGVPRLTVILKSLRQLGLGPLALNALYRLGVRTGHYPRVEAKALERIEKEGGPFELHPLFHLPDRDALSKILGAEGQSRAARRCG